MSDMKKLIEAVDQFAGQAVGQKPGDQVRGTDKATPKKSGKHPFAGRLVGASESKSLLADLEKELVEGAVKRGLAEEFAEFKEGTGLRPSTLASYKKKAGAEASKLDQEAWAQGGPDAQKKIAKADKRFSGIVRATKKEFDNDAKGVAEGSEIQVPTEDGIGWQDIRLLAGEGKLTQKTIKQAIDIIRKHRQQKQGVAEGHRAFTELELAIMEGGNSLEEVNPTDTVTLDIPLFIRLLEYAREDAKTDMDLHNVAENAIKLSAEGNTLSMMNYESIVPSDAVSEDVESFGYKRLHPEIFKARQQFPHAKSDMEALLMHVQDQSEKEIDRVDRVNDREDAEIDQLDREENSLESQIDALYAQLDKLKSQTKTVKEEVPAPVATAGGPAGANQPKTQPGVTPQVDPAQQALQKQNQAKMQQNLANLKSAGVQIDPAKAAQTLQKTDTGAPMNAMDKDNIAAMAPAIGNVMSNPSTASQLNTLIKKAGGGV